MAKAISITTIHDEMKDFCSRHKNGLRFEMEFDEQLPSLSTEGKSFPFVFASPIDFTVNGSINEHTIRIYVYNRIDRDRGNILDSVNDTSLIMSDIIKYWSDENNNSEIMIENYPIATAINNSQLDYLQGYSADIVFSIPTYSRCDIPLNK